jgi:hypothetical protein
MIHGCFIRSAPPPSAPSSSDDDDPDAIANMFERVPRGHLGTFGEKMKNEMKKEMKSNECERK